MVMLQNQYSEENPLFRSLSLILSRTEGKSLQEAENSFEQKWLNEVMGSCSVKTHCEKKEKNPWHKNIFI